MANKPITTPITASPKQLVLLLACYLIIGTNLCFAQQEKFTSYKSNSLPLIGEPADKMLSPAEERIIGINGLRKLYLNRAVLTDPESAHYIQHIGNRITNVLGSDKHEFTFFIINDPAINAFAMPGGFIGVNAGLILASNNESELAGVLAHEIAHVTQRHIARRLADMQKSSLPTLGAVLAGLLLGMNGDAQAAQAVMISGLAASVQRQLNYSRANEIEADRIGFDLLYRSGFNPSGMADFFKILQRKRMSPGDDQFEFLRTHPLDKTRISEAKNRAARLPEQNSTDSLSYHIVRARLQALMSNDTHALVHTLKHDKKLNNSSKIIKQYAFSQALEVNGDYKEASKLLQDIVRTDEENASFQIALARSLQSSGQNEQALNTLSYLYNLYPDHYPTAFYYSQALTNAGRLDESTKIIETYLHDNKPHTIEIYKLLAETHAKSNETVKSKKRLAEYYFRGGNFNAAIQLLRDALKEKDIDYITRSQIEQMLKMIVVASRDQ